jgi:hypothetical protein
MLIIYYLTSNCCEDILILAGKESVVTKTVWTYAIGSQLTAAGSACLHWRTFHRSVRTKNTTISRNRLQYRMTIFAIVKILTCISRHLLFFFMTTVRASDGRSQYYFCCHDFPSSVIKSLLLNGSTTSKHGAFHGAISIPG